MDAGVRLRSARRGEMACYKYISLGMSLSGKAGIVSFLHDQCAIALNSTLGPEATITNEQPPEGAKCPWCGKGFEEENL